MSSVALVLKFGWKYLRKYWFRLALSVVLGLMFALSNTSFMWAAQVIVGRFEAKPAAEKAQATEKAASPSKAVLDALPITADIRSWSEQAGAELELWLPRWGEKPTWRQGLGLLLFLPLLLAMRAATDYFCNYSIGWVSERVIRDLRLDVMDKLGTLSLDFFNRATTGDLLTRINGDTSSLMRALRGGGTDLIQAPLTILFIASYLIWMDWKLTLCMFVILPTCILPLFVLGKKARRATTANLKASIKQSSQLVEIIGSIRVVKAFGLEREHMERFRQTSAQMVHAGMKGVQAKELVNPLIEVVSALGIGALLLYVFSTGGDGKQLTAFLVGAGMLLLPIKKLAGLHILFEQAGVGTERLHDILIEQPSVKEPAQPKPLPPFSQGVTFENVSFGFGPKTVLHDFSLKIPRSHRLGLAGESGSGKTTILNLLYRFYDPAQGRILIDGLDLREVSMRDLRQQMAMVSQEVVLFDATVAVNIAKGKPGATREEIEAAARAAFAHDFIIKLPQGYDTRLGERGKNLSGGQQQRISIARAFIRNAPILVLDEATAALDSKAEAEVQAAIDALAEHRTVICVAHRLSTLATMDEILVLTEGRVVERGTFRELIKQGGTFSAMAARQGIFPGGTNPVELRPVPAR
jgi:ATP-binding cassette, subfamily B, bacterial MsbA